MKTAFAYAAGSIALLTVLSGCSSSHEGLDTGVFPDDKDAGSEGGPTGDNDAAAQPDAAACTALGNAANEAFATFLGQHSSCASDSDCAMYHWTEEPSLCVANCPVVMNLTGVAAAGAAASQDCAAFNAQQCPPPESSCPAFGSPICSSGTCALYKLMLSDSASFTHGVCTALTETYEQSWVPTAAPRDFPLTVTATNGAFYADGSCTTALSASGAITLPKGSSAVTFGFIPTTAGSFSITIDDGSGTNGSVSGQAE